MKRFDWDLAITELRGCDPDLGRIIDAIEPRRPQKRGEMRSPFDALLRSIVYQQLSGKAAKTIHTRLLALFPGRRPSARSLLAMDDETLRSAGLSRPKIVAVRDLAAKVCAREVPSKEKLQTMTSDAIIERLVKIRGIGQWTVEMLLIFNLDRADILPATDLGVRRGFMLCRKNESMPEPQELLEEGERRRPWRSVAAWYLWRACEEPETWR
ncbi:MAG: DNA-3-methyladenine glycosylase 2 family protein [Ectothiorhodospiraceae bacterium AqS1]|nr:DNA-3-methyladenine glycosylase 2 family protein [Ectothiorhodospiraceae bacterium AqS1]